MTLLLDCRFAITLEHPIPSTITLIEDPDHISHNGTYLAPAYLSLVCSTSLGEQDCPRLGSNRDN